MLDDEPFVFAPLVEFIACSRFYGVYEYEQSRALFKTALNTAMRDPFLFLSFLIINLVIFNINIDFDLKKIKSYVFVILK